MTTASVIERLAWNLSEIVPEFLSEFSRWRECLFCSNSNLAAEKLANLLISEIFIFPGGGSFAFGRSDANQQRSTVVRMRAICPLVEAEFGFCLAAAPESGDVKLLGKRIGAVEACE